jgi:hypothetical protein
MAKAVTNTPSEESQTSEEMPKAAQVESQDVAKVEAPSEAPGEAKTEETEESKAAAAPGEAPAQAPKTDWRDKKIAKLTARIHELAGTSKGQTPAVVAQPGASTAGTAPDPAAFEQAVERAAEAKAVTKAAQMAFNEACNTVATQGREAFQDFDSSVKNLKGLVDTTSASETAAYNSFLFAAIETGEAPKLLYELGKDPDEAMRIMSLPSVKMGIELAKRALGAGASQNVSNALKPITPVGRTGRTATVEIAPSDPTRADNLSTAEWMARREKEVLAARGRR